MKTEEQIKEKRDFVRDNLNISRPRSDQEYKNGLVSLLEWVLAE